MNFLTQWEAIELANLQQQMKIQSHDVSCAPAPSSQGNSWLELDFSREQNLIWCSHGDESDSVVDVTSHNKLSAHFSFLELFFAVKPQWALASSPYWPYSKFLPPKLWTAKYFWDSLSTYIHLAINTQFRCQYPTTKLLLHFNFKPQQMLHQNTSAHLVAVQWRCCSSLAASSIGHHHSDWAHTLTPICLLSTEAITADCSLKLKPLQPSYDLLLLAITITTMYCTSTSVQKSFVLAPTDPQLPSLWSTAASSVSKLPRVADQVAKMKAITVAEPNNYSEALIVFHINMTTSRSGRPAKTEGSTWRLPGLQPEVTMGQLQ